MSISRTYPLDRHQIAYILELLSDHDIEAAAAIVEASLPMSIDQLVIRSVSAFDPSEKEQIQMLIRHVLDSHYPRFLHLRMQQDFCPIVDTFLHWQAYIYDTSYFEERHAYEVFCHSVLPSVNSADSSENPKDVLNLWHRHIADRFVIQDDSSSIALSQSLFSQNISHYQLSILYLMIAETAGIPIFARSADQRLILMYAQPYCRHNEEVMPEDIQCYMILGGQDLVYSPFDLELIAMTQEQDISIYDRLPVSNQQILISWIEHLVAIEKHPRRKVNLSIKYQQIKEINSEIEFF